MLKLKWQQCKKILKLLYIIPFAFLISCKGNFSDSTTPPQNLNPVSIKKSTNNPKYLSCEGTSKNYMSEFSTDFYIPVSFLKGVDDMNEFYGNLSYMALQYIAPNINKHNQEIINAGIGKTYGVSKFIKSEDTTLPFSLDISPHQGKELSYFADPSNISYFMPAAQKYLANAYNIKKATKGDPAKKITFSFNIEVVFCLKSEDSKISFLMPTSPFLSYYNIPSSSRRPLQDPGYKSIQTLNPCANDESAYYNGIDPMNHSWHWNPFRISKGSSQNDFDCRSLQKEGIHFNKIFPKLTEVKKKDILRLSELKKLDRPLRIGYLNGFLKNSGKIKYFDKKDITQIITKVIKGLPQSKAVPLFQETAKTYDFNIRRYLILLWNIQKNSRILEHEISVTPQTLVLRLAVEFNKSRKKSIIDMVMTPSKHTKDEERFKDFREFFSYLYFNHDVFFYTGHSGSGENIDPENLKLNKFPDESKNKSLTYQMVSFNTCDAYTHNYDGKFIKPHHNLKRDLILTTSPSIDENSNYIIGVLDQLDRVLSNKEVTPFSSWVQKYNSKTSYILIND